MAAPDAGSVAPRCRAETPEQQKLGVADLQLAQKYRRYSMGGRICARAPPDQPWANSTAGRAGQRLGLFADEPTCDHMYAYCT
jgi:hypothetical protein